MALKIRGTVVPGRRSGKDWPIKGTGKRQQTAGTGGARSYSTMWAPPGGMAFPLSTVGCLYEVLKRGVR